MALLSVLTASGLKKSIEVSPKSVLTIKLKSSGKARLKASKSYRPWWAFLGCKPGALGLGAVTFLGILWYFFKAYKFKGNEGLITE